jgi:hypothetical protein
LHQATRFSRNQSEVDALYGAKFQVNIKNMTLFVSIIPPSSFGAACGRIFADFASSFHAMAFCDLGAEQDLLQRQDCVAVTHHHLQLGAFAHHRKGIRRLLLVVR